MDKKAVGAKWKLAQVNEVRGRWIHDTIERLVGEYHRELEEAQISVAFCAELPTRQGKRVLGKAHVFSEKQRLLTGIDLLIDLDEQGWMLATEQQRVALLDHELTHFALRTDAEGEPVRDTDGRLLYRSVPHDVQEFSSIMARYGAWLPDLRDAVEALAKGPASTQLRLALGEPDERSATG